MNKNKVEKIYEVPMKFVFAGKFFIKALSQEEANESALKDCGMVMGGNIHSSLPIKDVSWDFDSHPEKIIDNDTVE